jgi:hypothetical protein
VGISYVTAPALQQDVLRLDVAMDDPLRVGGAERVGHFARDAQRIVDGKVSLALALGAERFARDIRHHVVQQTAGVSGVEQGQDVRVLQLRGGLDLAQEPLAAERGAEVRVQDLDRDLTVVPHVLGEVHRGHPARTDLALDTVAMLVRIHHRIRFRTFRSPYPVHRV